LQSHLEALYDSDDDVTLVEGTMANSSTLFDTSYNPAESTTGDADQPAADQIGSFAPFDDSFHIDEESLQRKPHTSIHALESVLDQVPKSWISSQKHEIDVSWCSFLFK
jgi:hypothetical protein